MVSSSLQRLDFGINIVSMLCMTSKRRGNRSAEVLLILFAGPICRVNYLTQRGKTIQLGRILCLIFIPLFGVWGFTIFSLYDNVQGRNDIEAVSNFKILCRK